MVGMVARWRSAPKVEDQPVVTLVRWRIFSIPGGTRHFSGSSVDGPPERVRVSTPIVGFDAATATGMTQSGRLYRLQGPPGDDERTETGRIAWLASYGLGPGDAVPVELSEMAAAAH